jgi:hypothetical protein
MLTGNIMPRYSILNLRICVIIVTTVKEERKRPGCVLTQINLIMQREDVKIAIQIFT